MQTAKNKFIVFLVTVIAVILVLGTTAALSAPKKDQAPILTIFGALVLGISAIVFVVRPPKQRRTR